MKTSKLCVTGLCAGNSPGFDEFPAQMASKAENVPYDDVIMSVPELHVVLAVMHEKKNISWPADESTH